MFHYVPRAYYLHLLETGRGLKRIFTVFAHLKQNRWPMLFLIDIYFRFKSIFDFAHKFAVNDIPNLQFSISWQPVIR